jgi:UDP-3-O-[3-hydroxymyristoyl] N-acetylglucosamine deacetylase / 3-hydroxyacyl-[acyl-carrier-protein] dehydratase
MMHTKQHTLKEAIHFEGIGLHTGKKVKLTIEPAAENHGYKFQRSRFTQSTHYPC